MREYPIKWPPAIQIVIVLCIIAFMAAFLFPVFQHAPSISNRASCQSNLKQLGLAMIQYTQDADENFPPGVNAAGNGWAGQLYPFVKSTGVYRCPRDRQKTPFVSYAENRNLVKMKLDAFSQPTGAGTVALYEFSTPSCDPSTPETVSATGLNAPQGSTRHGSDGSEGYGPNFRLNFLMADGRVKWLTPEQVSNGPGAISPKALPQGTFVQTFAVK